MPDSKKEQQESKGLSLTDWLELAVWAVIAVAFAAWLVEKLGS
ncbi:hypothetical protein [Nocardiopsis composta]|uniref:Uncharacterized protein n=1 Tax=Nocardiopsis composta TaxID=157465 RepID=A0A7W8QJ89_9ACTN|nr:hypothetical protein [Nocardiopsis composta]MBB5430788.1 hypothetical protein [Nocardiopsis composta]